MNKWLIALFFNTSILLFWGGNNVLFAQSKLEGFYFDYRFDYAGIGSEKKEYISSANLSIPLLDFKGSIDDNKTNYGINFHTEKLFPKIPVQIKAGNLSLSGSISKLNSPALSSSLSPFFTAAADTTFIKASLPSYNQFNKPQSYFFQASAGDNKDFFKNIVLNFFSDSKTYAASTFIDISPFDILELKFSNTTGIFPYDKKKLTKWFNQELFYHASNHISSNTQAEIKIKRFYLLGAMNVYQSPFNDYNFTYSIENKIRLKRFQFNLSSFYNPNDFVLTSSDKTLSPVLQIKSGLQYQSLNGINNPVIVNSGFSTLLNINLNDTNHTVKSAVGFRITGAKYYGSFSASSNFDLSNEKETVKINFTEAAVQTTNSFNISKLKTELIANGTFSPQKNFESWIINQKYGINLSLSTNPLISFNNTLKLIYKNNAIKKESFTSSLNVKFQSRFCSLQLHLEFQV